MENTCDSEALLFDLPNPNPNALSCPPFAPDNEAPTHDQAISIALPNNSQPHPVNSPDCPAPATEPEPSYPTPMAPPQASCPTTRSQGRARNGNSTKAPTSSEQEHDSGHRSGSGRGSSSPPHPMDDDSNYPQEESMGTDNSGHHRKRQLKTCFNELCKSTDLFKRVKSKVEPSKYRTLCKTCHGKYSNAQFCEFCEQIYEDNTANEDDDLIWIGCDSCDRWNHIACEMKFRFKDAQIIKQRNQKYQCLNCTNKGKPKIQIQQPVKRPRQKKVEDPYQFVKMPAKRRTVRQIYNDQRNQEYHNGQQDYVDIFNTVRDNFPFLEQFLQNLNKTYMTTDFRLTVNDDQIREDLQRFKMTLSGANNSSNTEQDDQSRGLKRKKK